MNIKTFLACLLLLPVNIAFAQQHSPILSAVSKTIHIRDGAFFLSGELNPKLKPDIYDAMRSRKAKQVVFYTDKDSLVLRVKPGETYDFTVVLHGRDTCRQRITTNARSYSKDCGNCLATQDTIPFMLGQGNKIHIAGGVNQSALLDLLFDTGAATTVLYPSAKEKNARLNFDGTTENAGVGGTSIRQTSSQNRISIAKISWPKESVLFVDKQADKADGIIGFNVFSDKIVEIDYDRHLLIIHDTLFAIAPGYTRSKLTYDGYLPHFAATVMDGHKPVAGPFVFDSGSDGSMSLNPAFAGIHGLPGDLEELGSSTSHGVGAGGFKNRIVVLPELLIGGASLRDVPMNVPVPEGKEFTSDNVFGMDVMRRFNTIIDYQHGYIYLKPNALFTEPFKKPVNKTLVITVVAGIVVLAGILFVYYKARR
jgi:hypothetical protein